MFTKWLRINSSTASTLYLYSSRHSIRHLQTNKRVVCTTLQRKTHLYIVRLRHWGEPTLMEVAADVLQTRGHHEASVSSAPKAHLVICLLHHWGP